MTNDFDSKWIIFFEVDVLRTTGSCPHLRSSEKSPSENCAFLLVISKPQNSPTNCFPLMPDSARALITDLAAPNNPENAMPDPRG